VARNLAQLAGGQAGRRRDGEGTYGRPTLIENPFTRVFTKPRATHPCQRIDFAGEE
jgi:hypothetical protein